MRPTPVNTTLPTSKFLRPPTISDLSIIHSAHFGCWVLLCGYRYVYKPGGGWRGKSGWIGGLLWVVLWVLFEFGCCENWRLFKDFFRLIFIDSNYEDAWKVSVEFGNEFYSVWVVLLIKWSNFTKKYHREIWQSHNLLNLILCLNFFFVWILWGLEIQRFVW